MVDGVRDWAACAPALMQASPDAAAEPGAPGHASAAAPGQDAAAGPGAAPASAAALASSAPGPDADPASSSAAGASSGDPSGAGGGGLLEIVVSQRDRFRQRMAQLEEEKGAAGGAGEAWLSLGGSACGASGCRLALRGVCAVAAREGSGGLLWLGALDGMCGDGVGRM